MTKVEGKDHNDKDKENQIEHAADGGIVVSEAVQIASLLHENCLKLQADAVKTLVD